jgi:hypothetical protein
MHWQPPHAEAIHADLRVGRVSIHFDMVAKGSELAADMDDSLL